MIRVLLADDHALVRAGVRALLSTASDIEVVGEVDNGRSALRELERPEFEVDVLVLDVSMPRLNGFEVLERLRVVRPKLGTLLVSVHPAEVYAQRAIAAGASGYLAKSCTEHELVDAVRTIASGRVYATREAMTRPASTHRALSAREAQIFMLLVTGSSVTDIAAELDLGPSTVSTHIARIRTKLGLTSVAEFTSYAHREGLIG
jgi:two-component system invasion response regulator UvrY